jgi:tRNA-Thr(GGU) m(6)t(6)A37 methyltransferase TsaA
MTAGPLHCKPIGVIRTGFELKFDTPRQAEREPSAKHTIELYPGNHYEEALKDLAGFERIWLIWWFDRNQNWRPMVRTPRGNTHRRGVFATRSPHRPNPLGITSVPLIQIDGLTLTVGSTDLLDGTPILDIKPYISAVDSYPGQRQGWLDEVDHDGAVAPYVVRLSPLAEQQFGWLTSKWGIELFPRIHDILSRSPQPSRRHRITAPKDGEQRLSSGSWRIYFTVSDAVVDVVRIAPGFPVSLLEKEGREVIPHYQAQLAFELLWPTVAALP